MKLTVDNKDYELALTTRSALQLEERLKSNPINILLKMRTAEELPTLNEMLIILHAALQKYNHGMSYDSTIELFDAYMREGGTVVELLEIIVKVFQESGLIKLEGDEKNFL